MASNRIVGLIWGSVEAGGGGVGEEWIILLKTLVMQTNMAHLGLALSSKSGRADVGAVSEWSYWYKSFCATA